MPNRQPPDYPAKEDRAWESVETDLPLGFERPPSRGRTGLSRAGIALLVILAVAGIGAAVFYPGDAEYYFASLRRNIGDLVGVPAGNNPTTENRRAPPPEEFAALPEPEKYAETEASPPDQNESPPPMPEQEELPQPNINRPARERTKSPTRQARSPVFDDRESRSKQTELQIVKAIQNRAIDGVQVSVVDGQAFLDGRVATDRQKAAAEQATRSVPEVRKIQNRIEVGG